MAKLTLDQLKAKLTPAKQKAAELILEREYAPKGERATYAEISQEVGITERALYEWRKDPYFIQYLAVISDQKLDNYRGLADAQLIKLIQGTSNNGIASIKALELYYKLAGKLVERRETVNTDVSADSVPDVEKIKAEIERLRGMSK